MPAADYECYAVTAPGLERVAARELVALGLEPATVDPGGVAFRAHAAGLYRANLELRTISRVVVRMGSFHASSFHELERRAGRLPWKRFLAGGVAAEFRVTSRKSKLYHQDAVAERLGRRTGGNGPSQLFLVRIVRDQCTISADSSGELLHRRGYRTDVGDAPLRETLAAAMLLASGWDGHAPLADPFCGSGTIPIEAALIARRRAPGLHRSFAFERWPEFDALGWKRVKATARERVLPRAPGPIVGADRDVAAIAAAERNAERAGVAQDVVLRRASLSAFTPPPGVGGHLVTNPPYGVRVGERATLRGLYARLGDLVRTRCSGWEVTMLSPARELEHATGLPLASRLLVSNGGLRVRLVTTTRGGADGGAAPSTA
jgi:putative N6-adenine-specific DNA methylase